MPRVRIFGYRGVVQTVVRNPIQHSGDSIYLLEQPYEWQQMLELDGAAPQITVAFNPGFEGVDLTTFVRVECDVPIRYEVSPPGQNRIATENSPYLKGRENDLAFGAGYRLSVIDAAGT